MLDPDPRSYLIILLMVLAGGFFAAAETAYASCSRIRLMSWADDGKKSAQRALKVLDKFDKAIITLLIGNNAVHVVATSLAAVAAIRLTSPALGPVLATVVMTLLIFILSETIPKNIAKARCDSFACGASGILLFLMILLTPVDLLFMGLGRILKALFPPKNEEQSMTEEDFTSMIETIEDAGGLEADESELIQSAVEFTDRKVSEILTPRVRMVGLNLNDSEETNWHKILEVKYSRLPVYRGDLDHIVGILNTKQYLQARLASPATPPNIRRMMVKPFLIEGNMGLHALVEEMRRRKMHMAIVRDRFGGTDGMVTLEDLLEELVGDIRDEDEKEEAK